MVDDLRAALQQARDDGRVKAVVLEIDSPGGESHRVRRDL